MTISPLFLFWLHGKIYIPYVRGELHYDGDMRSFRDEERDQSLIESVYKFGMDHDKFFKLLEDHKLNKKELTFEQFSNIFNPELNEKPYPQKHTPPAQENQRINEPLKIPLIPLGVMIGCLYMSFSVVTSAKIGALFLFGFIVASFFFVESINAPNEPTWVLYILTLLSLVGAMAAYDISGIALAAYLSIGYAIGHFLEISASVISERFIGVIPDFIARLIIPCGAATGVLLAISVAFRAFSGGSEPTCLPVYGCY